jgi:cyanophycinase
MHMPFALRPWLPAVFFALLAALTCWDARLVAADNAGQETVVGPARGTLLIHGGGRLSEKLLHRFLELAGGPEALIVVIPSAGMDDEYPADWSGLKPLSEAGAKRLQILHTRDRQVADSPEFVRPLEQAGGVWIGGGRQWRLADAYLHTRTQQALFAVLARGGVIGGSSAGATIQGSFLVRGAPAGPHIMIDPGHVEGFGFLRGVAIDQHLLARERQRDMLAVLHRDPRLLGLGLDEGTAIIVQRDRFEVHGSSKIAIYDHGYRPPEDEPPYYFLSDGDQFDLAARKVLP